MSRFRHPSVHDLSPGSLRVWVLVGVALVFLALAALRPVIDIIGLNTRLIVAQQSLIAYRFAVLSQIAQSGTVPDELFQNLEEVNVAAGGEGEEAAANASPEKAPRATLGDALIQAKKIERISFPLGESLELPEELGALEPTRPQIWAVSLGSLAEQFREIRLFPSSRSGKVAVLVVPFLSDREAVGIQKMVSNLREQTDGGMIFVGDCFFVPSRVPGKFTGWLFLSDL